MLSTVSVGAGRSPLSFSKDQCDHYLSSWEYERSSAQVRGKTSPGTINHHWQLSLTSRSSRTSQGIWRDEAMATPMKPQEDMTHHPTAPLADL